MRRVIDEMHLPELTIVYGLTETSPGLTQTPRDADLAERTQTVGRVMPESRSADCRSGDRRRCADRRRRRVVGEGLRRDAGLLPDARGHRCGHDADGWLKSGDQASMDDAGRVRITGRIKDIIIRGGENIAPKEVEDVLRSHAAIADASVYAIASEFFGEEVAAALRLRPGATIDTDEVKAFCLARLARFKVPRFIRVVESFPLTASGKIQKFRLREDHEAEIARRAHFSAAVG